MLLAPSKPKPSMPPQGTFRLSDDQVRAAVAKWNLYWDYTSGRVWAKAIGWKRENSGPRNGQLGAIIVNPKTDERWHYGVHPISHTLVLISKARG